MQTPYSRIESIQGPDDVKKIPSEEIPVLCAEIRDFLIEKTLKNGGHLASNLGVVELTVALHRVFSTPKDSIIFDVGHQCYAHKILTGRAKDFSLLRKENGLSGFPVRKESDHDAFGTGHSSTSLSAALGFAEANRLAGNDAYVVAVVGDGAFTGGMIHEALNNCKKNQRLIIVLNDNEMSISKNIGLLSRYLARIRVSRKYNDTKRRTKAILRKIPLLGAPLFRFFSTVKEKLKRRAFSHNYFEDLGLTYLGPVDGHNEEILEKCLREAKNRQSAVILHCITKKGKGYAPAEENPVAFHGVSGQKKDDNFHTVVGRTLCALAEKDEEICAVTAAMEEGTGLALFGKTFPERFFDVGIAEEHAATFSAGLAAAGKKPYLAIYSTFLQRAYDNVLHDIALQELPVRLLIDRAGFALADGPTHHGIFDVAFLSHIPHIKIWEPVGYGSLVAMLEASLKETAPLAIRYPNGEEDKEVVDAFYPERDYATFGVRGLDMKGARVVFVSYGKAASWAYSAKRLAEKEVPCGMLLLETLKPYRETAKAVLTLLADADKKAALFFVEEGIQEGGCGMLLREALLQEAEEEMQRRVYRIAATSDGFSSPDFSKEKLAAQALAALNGDMA